MKDWPRTVQTEISPETERKMRELFERLRTPQTTGKTSSDPESPEEENVLS